MVNWYPIKFSPILKEKIWGGTKLNTVLGKDSLQEDIGESWEISSVKNNESIVVNGEFNGKTLKELIKKYKEELVGNAVYKTFKNNFPLLIKFIDAKTDLSVQLHPNDILVSLVNSPSSPIIKTDPWYLFTKWLVILPDILGFSFFLPINRYYTTDATSDQKCSQL